jgi:hypothetical protein
MQDRHPWRTLTYTFGAFFFRFGGGDEWFGAVVAAGGRDRGFDLRYDDGDFEAAVPMDRIRTH